MPDIGVAPEFNAYRLQAQTSRALSFVLFMVLSNAAAVIHHSWCSPLYILILRHEFFLTRS
ncbi:hypothetical protein Plhal304r1_c023g0080331 [Plasmopara halstedii]